jgi:RecJ-like exonuclease
MIILRCRSCNGTGEVTNEQYKICQALKSHATKRYFHLPMDEAAGDEREPQQHDACNSVPEKVECPVCEGAGEIAFDEDDWELQIVADEDEHIEE